MAASTDGGDLGLQAYYDRSYRDEQVLGKAEWEVSPMWIFSIVSSSANAARRSRAGHRLIKDDIEDVDRSPFEDGSSTINCLVSSCRIESPWYPNDCACCSAAKF
ncbi:MAG: hypothetical protein R2864_09040 [Syntrophotaleaceae bacterium]